MEVNYYGLGDADVLHGSIEELIEAMVDDACCASEDVIETLGPLEIHVYKKRVINIRAEADNLIDSIMESLDEEYGDPDATEYTKPNPTIRREALRFVQIVAENYNVWECEPTGEVIYLTAEEVEEYL